MKKLYTLIFSFCIPVFLFAGNPDRAGQAGASQLLINPWARSSGLSSLNVASIHGLEAERLNVAGMAFIEKTEILFSRTTWLSGSDIFINTLGIGQRIGESSVLGLSLMAFDFGDITTTTDIAPDGILGTYSPNFVNLGLSYSQEFSNRIYGGMVLRLISEGTADVKASGVALDAGIQYVTGKTDQIKFGIALRNVGTPMRFKGNGLATSGGVNDDVDPITLTLNQRSERFELPSLMYIAGAYDFDLGTSHELTLSANFTSNSFTKDQIGAGLEYSFKENFMVRAGYNYEDGVLDANNRTNLNTGFAAGASISVPFGEGASLGVDYSYRPTTTFDGTHTFGLRVRLD